jgi:predicted aldo/keto reductase-like oxidoreductase
MGPDGAYEALQQLRARGVGGVASVREVEENVEVAGTPRPLADRELEVIAGIRVKLGSRFCRRCDYCQPCPNEVPISLLLQVEGIRKRVGEPMMRTASWQGVFKKARACDQCGTCEPRCPFDLPIRDLVREARQDLARILNELEGECR